MPGAVLFASPIERIIGEKLSEYLHDKSIVVAPEARKLNVSATGLFKSTVMSLVLLSHDGTDEIIKKYANEYEWIEYSRTPERQARDFAGKVYAFKAGYEKVRELNYDILGNLDADISFDDPEYLEYILNKFIKDPNLGVAGTPFREGTTQYNYRFTRKEHVSGACQLFRRECFESIGGYVPLKIGAIDLVAVVTARMKGWKTETFTEKYCVHNRKMGAANYNILRTIFLDGYYDYLLGVHPLWEISRSAYNISRKPILLAGIIHMVGYFWAMLTYTHKVVPIEFVSFRRREQILWLKEFIRKVFQSHRFFHP